MWCTVCITSSQTQDMVSNDQSVFFELYTNRLKIAWFIEIIQTSRQKQKKPPKKQRHSGLTTMRATCPLRMCTPPLCTADTNTNGSTNVCNKCTANKLTAVMIKWHKSTKHLLRKINTDILIITSDCKLYLIPEKSPSQFNKIKGALVINITNDLFFLETSIIQWSSGAEQSEQ